MEEIFCVFRLSISVLCRNPAVIAWNPVVVQNNSVVIAWNPVVVRKNPAVIAWNPVVTRKNPVLALHPIKKETCASTCS